jgi:hypothetical protein
MAALAVLPVIRPQLLTAIAYRLHTVTQHTAAQHSTPLGTVGTLAG